MSPAVQNKGSAANWESKIRFRFKLQNIDFMISFHCSYALQGIHKKAQPVIIKILTTTKSYFY